MLGNSSSARTDLVVGLAVFEATPPNVVVVVPDDGPFSEVASNGGIVYGGRVQWKLCGYPPK